MITGLLDPIVSGFAWTQEMVISDENGVPYDEGLLNDCDFLITISDEDGCNQRASTADVTVLDAGTIQWTFPSIGLCQGRYSLTIDVTGDDAIPERIAILTLPVIRK